MGKGNGQLRHQSYRRSAVSDCCSFLPLLSAPASSRAPPTQMVVSAILPTLTSEKKVAVGPLDHRSGARTAATKLSSRCKPAQAANPSGAASNMKRLSAYARDQG